MQIAIAYAIKSNAWNQADSDHISLMTHWPPGEVKDNTPSVISYTHNGEPPLWGFEVKPGMQSYAWTKLLLDRNIQHSEFNDKMLETVTGSEILKLPDQKCAMETVADYLSRIYAYIQHHSFEAVDHLHSHGGDLSRVPIDFWFTILAS